MNGFARRLAVVLVVALASGHRSDAFCGLRSADGVDGDDLVACLKAKAIAALDRVSRADALPLTGSVTLVRDYDDAAARHRGQRSDEPPVTEQELRSRPDHALDRMLYDKAVGFFDGRSVRISFPELAADQLRTTLEEGRGKMKKTMGMMMTAAAMKAMMVIPLALGLLFLMAGKAVIISKIALILSLIITLKKLISKSGDHVVHESHSAPVAWPSAGSSAGYGSGGWDKRSSSATTGQMLAYSSYKP